MADFLAFFWNFCVRSLRRKEENDLKALTLYPYFAMILAATPNPGFPNPGLLCGLSISGEVIGPGGDDELAGAGLEVSVREGGGAMAAPPEVAEEGKTN